MADLLWIIVRSPNSQIGQGDLPATACSAYLVEQLEDEQEADTVRRFVNASMLGCELAVLNADGATRYQVGPTVEPVPAEGS